MMALLFVVNEFVHIYRYFSFKLKNVIILTEPGKPRSLDFFNITMTSLNVTWEPPSNPNGIIKFYGLTYRSLAGKYSYTLM